ncbi:MAG TPA: nuclear transport factor 2 family protein [Terracidiphilus sp.]|nr:nuclear transport factor 2 family protein [Terracidiphilus sp.]
MWEFAARYTAAWCSQDAASVAAFFAIDGSLTINGGIPSVGQEAITAAAQSFMTAFPDLRVEMEDLVVNGEEVEYRWRLLGTHAGPGGTGNQVDIRGFERWQFGADGRIASSQGRFDSAEYQKQLEHGAR